MKVSIFCLVLGALLAGASWWLTDKLQVALIAFGLGQALGFGIAYLCWPWEQGPR